MMMGFGCSGCSQESKTRLRAVIQSSPLGAPIIRVARWYTSPYSYWWPGELGFDRRREGSSGNPSLVLVETDGRILRCNHRHLKATSDLSDESTAERDQPGDHYTTNGMKVSTSWSQGLADYTNTAYASSIRNSIRTRCETGPIIRHWCMSQFPILGTIFAVNL